jgi:hypothetical protein
VKKINHSSAFLFCSKGRSFEKGKHKKGRERKKKKRKKWKDLSTSWNLEGKVEELSKQKTRSCQESN